MITLYNGMVIPNVINTSERIFQIVTVDNETVLCNLEIAQRLIRRQECKSIKHYWDYKFQSIGKKEVLEMLSN